MKLLIYELNKLINKKIFYLFLMLCLVINGFLFYSTQNTEENRTRLEHSEEYISMIDKYAKLSVNDAKKSIDNEILAYSIASSMNELSQLEDQAEIEELSKELQEYKTSTPAAYQQALKISIANSEETHGYQLAYRLQNQIDYVLSYPEFISGMWERADNQAKLSGFNDKNSFSYKNLYKTADDYEHLKNTRLSLVNNESVTAATQFGITDIFIIAITFLICIYLFNYEREQSLYPLVKCTLKGRLNTIAAKLGALFVTVIVTVLLFEASDFLMGNLIYGNTDLSASIQSVSEFRNCTFALNILQFELLFILFKIIVAIITAAFIAFVFINFSSPFLMYTVGVGVLAIEYLLYAFVDASSALNLLKYINIFYLFDGGEFIGRYLNLDLFSNAVTANSFVTIFFVILCIALIIVTSVQFCLKVQQKKASALSKWLEKIKSRFYKIKGSTSLFIGESFKFLVQNKMAFLLILLALYAIYSSIGVVRYPYADPSDYQYKSYMDYLSGDITPEKEKYIKDEREYLDELETKIEEISVDKKLSANAKQAMIRSVQNTIDGKQEAYERVREQYNRLKELKKQGVEARFIDENVYSVFVSSDVREWNNFIMFCLLIIVVIPCIFTVEYKNKMINLIRPTPKGKLRLFWNKILIAFITSMFIFTVICLPYIIRFIYTYGTDSFKTALVCLYTTTPNHTLSVIDAFVLNQMIYLVLALSVMCITIAFSIATKNNLYVMIICSVMLLAPGLACYSVEAVRIGYMTTHNNILALVLTVIISMIVMTISLFLSEKKFTNSLIRRKYAYS